MSIVWLDYLDARRRLVHAWHEQELAAVDIALRLELDSERVETILTQPVDPPLPGSSRALVAELRRRVAELERALHATPVPSRPPPVESGCRELAPEDGGTGAARSD